MANERSGTLLGRAILKTQPDERLVRLTREGHDAAYEEIVRRYRPRLVRQATAIVPAHRAEDVVQESLTRALSALRSSDSRIALPAWLATIVRNRSLNDLRDEAGPHEELDNQYDGVPQPPVVAAERQEVRDVVAAIGALPETQRRALIGRELEGRSHEEIASELGVTPGAARGLIFRARGGLRDALGALIPLPAIRYLMEVGSADATSGAAAGAGAIAAGMSAGTKATVGVLAVLATVAIEQTGEDREGNRDGSARAEAVAPADGSAQRDRHQDNGASGSGDGRGDGAADDDREGESEGGEEREGSDDDNSGSGDDDDELHEDRSGPGDGDDEDTSGPGDDSGSGDSSGPGGESDSGDSSGSGGNSGPGGGGDLEEPLDPVGDDNDSGPGDGDSSGSGSGSSGNSGPGSDDDALIAPQAE